MNKIQKQRLSYVICLLIALALASSLILYALKQNINVFLTPSEAHASTRAGQFRLGGLVKAGSVKRDPQGLGVDFVVTDLKKDLPVRYSGILPDLFGEGKGVIAEGKLNAQGTFVASFVLAKHDENYMPKNVYQAMKVAANDK